jgi:hypothetical protein
MLSGFFYFSFFIYSTMKNYANFLNEGEIRREGFFSIRQLSQKYGNLDQSLLAVYKKIKGKVVQFTPLERNKPVWTEIKEVYYKRYVREDGKLGNLWFFINKSGKEFQLNINDVMQTYAKVNEFDPYGEEDWEN